MWNCWFQVLRFIYPQPSGMNNPNRSKLTNMQWIKERACGFCTAGTSLWPLWILVAGPGRPTARFH